MAGMVNETLLVHAWKEKIILPIFMFAGGAIGNIIAIVVLSMSRQESKSSAFYTLVCGLAVTDLLGTCLASPLTIANYLDLQVLQGGTLCDFHSFLLLFFSLTGLSIICAMAAERYLAICCPYLYQRWGVDRRFAQTFLTSMYATNVLFCCLPMTGAVRSRLQPSQTWCFIDLRTPEPVAVVYSVLYGAVSVLLIVGTAALNVAVCGALLLMRRRSVRRRTESGRSSVRDRWRALSSAAEIQIMTVLVMTSLVVVACSAPLVRVFANRLMLKDDSEADLAAIRIASVNPILDPWIYILLRRSLFRRLLNVLLFLCATQSHVWSAPEENFCCCCGGGGSSTCTLMSVRACRSKDGFPFFIPHTDGCCWSLSCRFGDCTGSGRSARYSNCAAAPAGVNHGRKALTRWPDAFGTPGCQRTPDLACCLAGVSSLGWRHTWPIGDRVGMITRVLHLCVIRFFHLLLAIECKLYPISILCSDQKTQNRKEWTKRLKFEYLIGHLYMTSEVGATT
uniref:G-protein coupled receptors family 1 profile domain-containing protein n=1 Tax=Hippocampus comes TaxID=109280 RepID=A0A3Q2YRU1_HIPCM